MELSTEGLPEGCDARCPACKHRTLSRTESEKQKEQWLRSKLSEDVVAPLVGDAARKNYRAKVCLSAEQRDGRWHFGFRVPSAADRDIDEVVDIPRCPVHAPRVLAVQEILARRLPRDLPLAYVLVSGVFVTLVLKTAPSESFDFLSEIAPELSREGVQGFFLNFHPSAGDRVLSSRGWRKIWGESFDRDERGLVYGPASFQQLIPGLHSRAMNEARAFLAPAAGDFVVDLCSGTGASLALWREAGASCIGVELGGEAVECAEKNLGPGFVLRGKASERIPQMDAYLSSKIGSISRSLLFANPPRTGLELEILRWIAGKLRPERIAYLSCSAGTLARDLEFLKANPHGSGYALRKVTPYDVFPQTHHVEALALIERD